MAVNTKETKKKSKFRAVLPAFKENPGEVALDRIRRGAQAELSAQTFRSLRQKKHRPAVASGLGPDMEPPPPLITT